MAEGTVAGTNAEIILSARQCTEIGIHAVATNFFYQAVQWLDTAINKIIAQGDTGGVLLEEAQTQLEIAKMAVSGARKRERFALQFVLMAAFNSTPGCWRSRISARMEISRPNPSNRFPTQRMRKFSTATLDLSMTKAFRSLRSCEIAKDILLR